MSKSRPYSAVSVKTVEIEALASQRCGQKCMLGVDVSKLDLKGVLHWADGTFHRPWAIKSPGEIRLSVQKLALLNEKCPLTVVMESSGTYGDAFRQALGDAKIPVLRVSGKAVKDQSETFDGVPSQHDGKDSAIIADLGQRGKGKTWELVEASERDPAVKRWTTRKRARDGGSAMRALVAVMRRLALAAWHVAKHGVKFDAAKLFPSGQKLLTKSRR